ncbi:MAG TPA: DUF3426 domain-containing protein [Xanthobacteraceae bacterium]|nr:DUF3426 domain-containing protein [Xanthobacteraceae bacterium]
MLIVCPQCATSYQVDLPALVPGGRSVRCARCKTVWFAAAPTVVPALATGDDFDVVDKGAKVPLFEASPREAEPIASSAMSAPEPEQQREEFEPASESPGDPPVEMAAADSVQSASEGPADPPVEPASLDGIDVEGLRADMEAEHADQAAAADAVLADVTAGQLTVESPPLAPAVEASGLGPAPERRGVDNIESTAARRLRRVRPSRRPRALPGPPTLILALLAANTAIAAWRSDIVRYFPQTASLYAAIGLPVNLRGLSFDDVKLTREQQEGLDVLVVQGSISNVTGRPQEVPRIRIAVRNQTHNEVYVWTTLPARAVLGPRETLPFQARLASPPKETQEVLVRFFNRRDIVAGLH